MKRSEQRLLQLFRELMPAQQDSLMDFAEFLAGRSPDETAALEEPVPVARPEQETVIAAMKRLTSSYPMIDPQVLFHDASNLLTQHLLRGRAASEVIDDLEHLFRRTYESMARRANS